jgi:hypothetical protein
MALGTAFRAFFAALFDREVSGRLQAVLDKPHEHAAAAITDAAPSPTQGQIPKTVPPSPKSVSPRSDAITLLATLQREARFVDLVKENLSQYSDAQIGAAARPCLQQCAATLDRLVGLRAIETAADGQLITVPDPASPSRYLWVGEGSGTTGKLIHHGWEASHVELPQWSGHSADAKVIAPIQVQRV